MREASDASSSVLVFTRAPVAGRVKTRLAAVVGAELAAGIHMELTRYCLDRLSDAALGPVQLWYADEGREVHPFIHECAERYGVSLHRQVGADLGERMAYALRSALSATSCSVLIGTDIPALVPGDVAQALQLLGTGSRAVLGPTLDGGYGLVGLHAVDDALFTGVSWGSDQVLAQTRERLIRLGWDHAELPTRWDIDFPADLLRLRVEQDALELSRGLREVLEQAEARFRS